MKSISRRMEYLCAGIALFAPFAIAINVLVLVGWTPVAVAATIETGVCVAIVAGLTVHHWLVDLDIVSIVEVEFLGNWVKGCVTVKDEKRVLTMAWTLNSWGIGAGFPTNRWDWWSIKFGPMESTLARVSEVIKKLEFDYALLSRGRAEGLS